MRSYTVEVFQIEELSPEAREVALEKLRQREGEYNFWDVEWGESLSTGVAELGMKKGRYPYWRYYLPNDDVADLSGTRAWKWIANNIDPGVWEEGYCPTGYYGDYSFFAPLVEFMRLPDSSSIGEVFSECVDSLKREWDRDSEWRLENEQLTEGATANETEFLKDGNIF